MNNSEPDSYDKKKVNVLVRLHKVMQEKSKTASYSEPIQILTLVPDKWSRMFCSECFNMFEYLVSTSHEIKKVGETLADLPAEKEKEDYVSMSKAVHKQKLQLAKVFVTCKDFILLSMKNSQM